MSDVEQLGKVRWGFQGTGHVTGLESIYRAHPHKDPNFLTIHTLCREAAIAKSEGGLQFNFVEHGKQLVELGILTQAELDFIYKQFELDLNALDLPDNIS